MHHNRCLRVKATFAESVIFPANIAFAARAAILAALLWLWCEWWEWRQCRLRLMAVLVVDATMVIVVMDPVDPRLDCCTCRSSHCRSQSHEMERGLVVGLVVVVAIKDVIVGWSCHVVMGVIQKGFYLQKRLHGSLVLALLPPGKFHGRSFARTATSMVAPTKPLIRSHFYRLQRAINTPSTPTSGWKGSHFLQMMTTGNGNMAVKELDPKKKKRITPLIEFN